MKNIWEKYKKWMWKRYDSIFQFNKGDVISHYLIAVYIAPATLVLTIVLGVVGLFQ